MNPSQQDQIDSYLRGELSSDEAASFEQQMQKDPVFESQVNFEQSIYRGLSEVRKAELKSRLSAIQPPSSYFAILGSNTLMKVAGGLFSVAIIGAASYLYFDESGIDDLRRNTPTISNDAFNHPKTPKQEIAEITIPESTVKIEEQVVDINPVKTNHIEQETRIDQVKVKNQVTTVTEETKEDFVPDVAVPSLSSVDENTQSPSSDADMPEISSTDQIEDRGEEPIDVKTVQRNTELLKYRYYEGKLFLYGNFKENPYEILEINSTGSRKIYLFFMDTYYEVETTDKVQELQEIDSQKLIDELEIIRNNKF